MPSTSSLAQFGNDTRDAAMSFRVRPDRDDASSGYDSPDECSETFEKPQQIVQQ
jgi:hypothetical protein